MATKPTWAPPLAVYPCEVRRLLDQANACHLLHVRDDLAHVVGVQRELEVDVRGRLASIVDIDIGDVGVMVGEHLGQA
jgi:hypothetical protein